jgi:hypothetical protein
LSPSTHAPRGRQFVLHAKRATHMTATPRGDVIEATKQLTGCPIERA